MFRQHLLVHWKTARWGLLPIAATSFAVPLLAVQGVPDLRGTAGQGLAEGVVLIGTLEGWAPVFPALAFAVGAVLGMSAWQWDHRAGHVYALSLPVSRWRYVLDKMLAGGTLLFIPVALFGIGVALATGAVAIPDTLQSHSIAVTVRFGLAAAVAFALMFALASATIRTALWMLTGVVVFVIAGSLVTEVLASTVVPELADISPVALVIEALGTWPGPFGIFTGNWMMIDV